MKRLLAAFILIGITTTVISLTPNEQEKEYIVKMTLNEWNVALVAINSPDDVTANQKKFVISKISDQVKAEIKIQDSLLKIKAVQDSIKNKKN